MLRHPENLGDPTLEKKCSTNAQQGFSVAPLSFSHRCRCRQAKRRSADYARFTPSGWTRPSVVTPGSDPREYKFTYNSTKLPFLDTTILDANNKSSGSMMQTTGSQRTLPSINAHRRDDQLHQQYRASTHGGANSLSSISEAKASAANAVPNDIQTTTISTTFWPIHDMEVDDVSDVSSLSSTNMLVSTYETNDGEAA